MIGTAAGVTGPRFGYGIGMETSPGVSPEERSWHGAPPGPDTGGRERSRIRDRHHAPPPAHRRFAFRFEPTYRIAALPFSVDADHAYVEVDRPADATLTGTLRARFGPWTVETSLDNVVSTHVTGPYRRLKTIGPPHLSLADRGLTFATNHECGVCIVFRDPVVGIEPLGVVRHPALTVTVNDVAGLRDALDDAG